MKTKEKTPEELAEAHAKWISEFVKYNYKNAFVHGYGHGWEDAMKKVKKIVRELNLPDSDIGKVIVSIRKKFEKKVRSKISKYEKNVRFSRNVDEIMIVPVYVDKGLGVRLAMQYLNIDFDKTIVIGDGENDVDMFLNPGFKIALANANEKLKKLANQVTINASVKGVLEIITKLKIK